MACLIYSGIFNRFAWMIAIHDLKLDYFQTLFLNKLWQARFCFINVGKFCQNFSRHKSDGILPDKDGQEAILNFACLSLYVRLVEISRTVLLICCRTSLPASSLKSTYSTLWVKYTIHTKLNTIYEPRSKIDLYCTVHIHRGT